MQNKNDYEKAFSLNVRRLRKKLNITQKSLADAMGYSEKTVSKSDLYFSLKTKNKKHIPMDCALKDSYI